MTRSRTQLVAPPHRRYHLGGWRFYLLGALRQNPPVLHVVVQPKNDTGVNQRSLGLVGSGLTSPTAF